MFLRPIPMFLELPSINDVTHKIDSFRCVIFKEVEKIFGFALSGAKMYIGNPDCTITFHICKLNMMSVKVS
jgi:hypothetical protein